MKKKLIPWIFLGPSFIGVCIFSGVPFLDVVRRSLSDMMGKQFVKFDNYKEIFHNEAFFMAVKNTGRFLLVCIPLLLFLSLSLALMIRYLSTGRQFFKSVFLIPMAVPVASIVVLWKTLFDARGVINLFFTTMDLPTINFMNSGKAFGVLVFSYLWKNIGYDMILWLAGLAGISESYYEAASVDGAGAVKSFFYITLPMLLPNAMMIIILSFVNSFKVFREAYLISGNYPDTSIYMMQHLFNNWFSNLDIQKMSAAAVLMAAFIFGIAVLFWQFSEEK